jgi:murein DD-endopeptidase MepM/ murein hydrolase activator NlpD
MRLMSTAASAAFIASVALTTATAAVPAARPLVPVSTTSPVSTTKMSTAKTSPAQSRVLQVGPIQTVASDAAAISRVAPHVTFGWPLSPRPELLRPFDRPLNQWSLGHRGVDLLAVIGQPVLSAGDGIVTFSGVIAGRGVVTIRHSEGLRTTYEPVDERSASGTVVHRGTRIGILSGVPGHCVPLHCVHWGAISGEDYRDPLSLLGFGRPILLPLG